MLNQMFLFLLVVAVPKLVPLLEARSGPQWSMGWTRAEERSFCSHHPIQDSLSPVHTS